MKVLVLGGDGYLGWPTAMHLSKQGFEVAVADNFVKRRIEMEDGIEPLEHCPTLHQRIKRWKELTGHEIQIYVGDLLNQRFVYMILEEFQPDAIVHYAEQPSAPYSMQGRGEAVFTQQNNIIGTLNLVFAIKSKCPDAHLVKLGTMGEYGSPNIDIEEGYLEIEHNGRKDTFPFPKKPGSFYHLSKVHDSNNLIFASKIWGLKVTDLNQGIVYGVSTDETEMHPELRTSFHYDHIFGTVLNRFCVEAVKGIPLTVYGKGTQIRGILNIRDTLQCVELAIRNSVEPGECRIMNQFTESFSLNQLADFVQEAGKELDLDVVIDHIPNPRIELEEHYYNAKHTKLIDLGLKPHLLTKDIIVSMMRKVQESSDNILLDTMQPKVKWHGNS